MLAVGAISVPARRADDAARGDGASWRAVAGRDFERGFDEGMAPATPVTPGLFATPLAMMSSTTGHDRISAAFALVSSPAAAGPGRVARRAQRCRRRAGRDDRRRRPPIAHCWRAGCRPALHGAVRRSRRSRRCPPGLVDALFGMLNRETEIEQLAAMDALGLMRQTGGHVA